MGTPTGTGTAVAYTFSLRIALTGRLLQGGVAGINELLDSKLNDGSLVAAVAESGLAPALGYDSADSLINAVTALPAALVLPSVSATSSPSQGSLQATVAEGGGLSQAALAGIVVGGVAVIAALLAWWQFAKRPSGNALLALRVESDQTSHVMVAATV